MMTDTELLARLFELMFGCFALGAIVGAFLANWWNDRQDRIDHE